MWGPIGKISAIILILAVIALIIGVNHLRKRQEAPPFPGGAMIGVREEVERYDNWALSEEVYFGDNRVAKYADKMMDESTQYSNDEGWISRNSWRFGFYFDEESQRMRYVGVFHAEQLYYSGISLSEYVNYQQSHMTGV